MYYITEGSGKKWEKTGAKTLAGAKRAASRAQTFQGTDLFVAIRHDDAIGEKYHIVSKKLHRYALDMAATGGWEDIV